MKWTSLDTITRSVLQQKQYPIHYYLHYLKLANDCYRELHFDTLRVINTRRLPVSATGAVTLPCDYVDFVRVGIPIGQVVKPLHQQRGINRLADTDASGQVINYGGGTSIATSLNITYNINDNDELIGRFYSFSDGLIADTYKVLPERNEIQLNEAISIDFIVLEYISDGTYSDAATKVDLLAQSTIEAHVHWKCSPNANIDISAEAKTYYRQWRKLKARKSGLTIEDIKRSYYSNIKPTIR